MDADFDRTYNEPVGSIGRELRSIRFPEQRGQDSADISADPVFAPHEQAEQHYVHDHEADHPR